MTYEAKKGKGSNCLMFNLFRQKDKPRMSLEEMEQRALEISKQKQHELFKNIIGYDDLKLRLIREIEGEYNSNVLLVGPPGTAKSLFGMEMQKKLKQCFYFDGTGLSGRGLFDYLASHKGAKIIFIDEIDKLNKKEQTSLYNLMETGKVIYQTARVQYNFVMLGLKVFATSNSIERLNKPLKSRFAIFRLPEYDFEEFMQIGIKLLSHEYKLPEQTALMVVDSVWNKMNSKDVRDLLKIAKVVRKNDSLQDIEQLIEVQLKYAADEEENKSEFN
jgi:Holliday junction DNA helicase RuvB